MTLTDSGPIAAIYLPDDAHHVRCVAALAALSLPMVTTMACFTEAMHFLGKARGRKGRAALWGLVGDGRLEVRTHTADDLERMRMLMAKYADLPMDLADASLVALAEHLNMTLIFTLDSHFKAYRLRDRRSFRVTPPI
jgi:predicted nucleic acid-binding protein